MSERRIDAFFYGLFMDDEILRSHNVVAADPRRAHVDDFELRIGHRATLVPAAGKRAYGMLYAITHGELKALYTGPGLDQYRPEAVLAATGQGRSCPALCYNLPNPPGESERNAEYADRLKKTLRKLGFPAEYIAGVG